MLLIRLKLRAYAGNCGRPTTRNMQSGWKIPGETKVDEILSAIGPDDESMSLQDNPYK
jgi:hypothetical protein